MKKEKNILKMVLLGTVMIQLSSCSVTLPSMNYLAAELRGIKTKIVADDVAFYNLFPFLGLSHMLV